MDRLFKCQGRGCSKVFKYAYQLRRHQRVHTNECNFLCDQCPSQFKCSWHLRAHQRTRHHNASPRTSKGATSRGYNCARCAKPFRSRQDVALHIARIHLRKIFGNNCFLCRTSFTRAYNLRRHMAAHARGKMPNRCGHCSTAFFCFGDLRKHMRNKHGDEVDLDCPDCGKSFHRKCDLQAHLLAHFNVGAFRCAECSMTFKYSNSLRRHQISYHSRDGIIMKRSSRRQRRHFGCSKCAARFHTVEDLIQHFESHGRSDRKAFRCSKCDKKFADYSYFLMHQRWHEQPDRFFQCAVCCRRFPEWHILRKHLRLHGPKIFRCQLCPAAYPVVQYLRRHQAEHSTEQPYKCCLCPKAFKSRERLRKHEQRHRAKRFQCRDCPATLRNVRNLRMHLAVHSTERPYKCSLCEKAFKLRPTLKQHERVHMKGNLKTAEPSQLAISEFACHIWNAGFGAEADLNEHIALHSKRSTSKRLPASRRLKAGTSGVKSQRHLPANKEASAKTKTSSGIFQAFKRQHGRGRRSPKVNAVPQRQPAHLQDFRGGSSIRALPDEATSSVRSRGRPQLRSEPTSLPASSNGVRSISFERGISEAPKLRARGRPPKVGGSVPQKLQAPLTHPRCVLKKVGARLEAPKLRLKKKNDVTLFQATSNKLLSSSASVISEGSRLLASARPRMRSAPTLTNEQDRLRDNSTLSGMGSSEDSSRTHASSHRPTTQTTTHRTER